MLFDIPSRFTSMQETLPMFLEFKETFYSGCHLHIYKLVKEQQHRFVWNCRKNTKNLKFTNMVKYFVFLRRLK